MEFSIEKIEDIYDEAYHLFEKHNDEVGVGLELDIDLDYYLQLEEMDACKFFTLRDKNELIGYAIYCITYEVNHKNKKLAVEKGVFIEKSRRGGGLEFITYCEQSLKALGITEVIQVVPITSKWGKFLKYKGYKEIEVMYSKEL